MDNPLHKFSHWFVLCVSISVSMIEVNAQHPSDPYSNETAEECEARLSWWHEARFGMFIHLGVYSSYAGIYNGHDQAKSGAEWIMNRCKIPVAEYREHAKAFNPTEYDPDAWVRIAKEAGMKYIIITAKHHDGFALFDSAASDWNVVDATQYGEDLLKPLAEACKKHGIKLGFYYSQAQDWCNPGGTAARKLMNEGWPNPDADMIDAYAKKHKGYWDPAQESKSFEQYIDQVAVPQVRNLLTNYGDISVLWWDTPTRMTDEAAMKFQELLKLQHGIITNDRLKRPNFRGDTKTPEQHIPKAQDLEGENWEVCMTMNKTWGYGLREMDKEWKSVETLLRNLVDIASKGGNYLLNVGPKPDGVIPAESVVRLKKIGDWMDVNGEAIYGTMAGPYEPFSWGRCSRKVQKGTTRLYFFVFDWPADRRLVIPDLTNECVTAALLADGHPLTVKKDGTNLEINLPEKAPDPIASVIKVVVEGNVKNQFTPSKDKAIQSGALDTKY